MLGPSLTGGNRSDTIVGCPLPSEWLAKSKVSLKTAANTRASPDADLKGSFREIHNMMPGRAEAPCWGTCWPQPCSHTKPLTGAFVGTSCVNTTDYIPGTKVLDQQMSWGWVERSRALILPLPFGSSPGTPHTPLSKVTPHS